MVSGAKSCIWVLPIGSQEGRLPMGHKDQDPGQRSDRDGNRALAPTPQDELNGFEDGRFNLASKLQQSSVRARADHIEPREPTNLWGCLLCR